MEEKLRKLNKRIYGIGFFAVILIIGAFSLQNLMNYYINDEVSFNAWMPDAGDVNETNFIVNMAGKESLINLNGVVRAVLNQHEMNDVVKLNNGYLTQTIPMVDIEVLAQEAETLGELQDKLEAQDIQLLYVATGCTVSKYDPQLPIGVEDYSNQNVDNFLEKLEEQNVHYIDMREEIYMDGLDHYELFYKTDHHWTTEGGFYAYTKIVNEIEDMLDTQVSEEVKSLENYEITTYENWHLGTRGKRVGAAYAGVDDFTLILPKFENYVYNTGTTEEGSLQDIVINVKALEERNLQEDYVYDQVLGASLGFYANPNASSDKNVLIICDSMGKAVNPYMILSFQKVGYIDAYNPSDLTLERIESFEPDIVVIMQYPWQLGSDLAFSFGM